MLRGLGGANKTIHVQSVLGPARYSPSISIYEAELYYGGSKAGFVNNCRMASPGPSAAKLDHTELFGHTTRLTSLLKPTLGGQDGSLQVVTVPPRPSTWRSTSRRRDHNGRPVHLNSKTRVTTRVILLFIPQHIQGHAAFRTHCHNKVIFDPCNRSSHGQEISCSLNNSTSQKAEARRRSEVPAFLIPTNHDRVFTANTRRWWRLALPVCITQSKVD